MTMAQQYFQSHSGVDPKLVASAREKLERGYQRLVGFETKEKGYEWFGEAPGHEALTAFGLLHFADMKQVREVDTAMLARTREWLLQAARRQGRLRAQAPRAAHVDRGRGHLERVHHLGAAGERDRSRRTWRASCPRRSPR